MSIAYGGIVAFLFRGVNVLVALATVLVTSRLLGKDDYGVLFLGLVVIGVVTAMTGGLTAAIAYQISNQRKAPGTALVSGGVPGLLAGGLAVGAGVLGTQLLTGEMQVLSLAVGIGAAAVVVQGVVAGVFLGKDSLVRYNITLVLPPLFSLICMVVVLVGWGHRTPESALAAYAAGQWAAAAVLLAMAGGDVRAVLTFNRSMMTAIVQFAVLGGISSGISFLNYRADTFVVRHFEGDGGVGVYAIALYVGESVWQVSGSLALAIYGRIGTLTRDDAAALVTRVMRHTLVIILGVCVCIFLGAGLVEKAVSGRTAYPGVASAIRFLLPGVLLYSLAPTYSAFYTYQRGLPWVAAFVAGGGLIIDITLDFVLIPHMGVNGAALASSIAYAVAILAGLAVFVARENIKATDIFRFGRADVDDYRVLIGRLRSAIGRPPAVQP